MKYVVIGASAAGIHACSTLRDVDPAADIILISKDTDIVSRCILYHHLKGIRDLKRLSFVEDDFMEKNHITWHRGCEVTGVDTERKVVKLADHTEIAYDKLLIATGSHSFLPPIPQLREAENVVGFRDFDDVEEIERRLPDIQNIVVMGGGLVGVDVVSGLLPHGKNITLVEMGERMLPLQLDDIAAHTYQEAFAKEGVHQYYGTGIECLKVVDGSIREVTLSNGVTLPCDLLISAAGVRANVEFLSDSGITCDKFGLVFDAHGATNICDVYGAGDVSGRMPIWPVAVKEGIIAASNMAGVKKTMDDFFASKATMNFLGIPTMSLGKVSGYDDSYMVETMQDGEGNYKKIIHKDGIIYGALLQGDLSYAGILTQLIRASIDVSKVKKPLFQIDYSDFFHMQDNFEFTYETAR